MAITARISRNRAPTLRATTTIARHTRTAAAARISRHRARTTIRHPLTPRRAAAIRRLRVRILLPAAATPHQAIALVAVAEAIAAEVVEVAAPMAAEVVEVAVPMAAEVAADHTVAVAVPTAAAPTATDSRSNARGPLRSRSGPLAFPSHPVQYPATQPLQWTPRVPHNSSASQVFNSLKQIGPLLIRHTKKCPIRSGLKCSSYLAHLHSGPDPNRPKGSAAQAQTCSARVSGENVVMRKHALKLISLIAFTLAVAIFVPQRAAADQDDPPGRIARLSLAEGSVSFEPAGTDDWVTAVVNRPLTTGDKLWADHDSRAELHLGSASIRLGANTGFSFLNLDDNTVQLQLTEGTLRIRVRHLYRDEVFEVDTPNLAFTALRPGIYRINVNDAGDTTVVVVRQGEGEVTGGGQSYSVHSDETGIFSGTDQLNADIEGVGSEDDFEHWSYERDRREDRSASRRYVSEDAIGYEDLDQYGGWRDTREYGTVWFPQTTVVGWAPYRYGHWVWIAPWGYTWVDDEPRGFAPFHYGRWVVVGGVWGWVPCRPAVVGVAYVRPVYAPALVAWVGGPHFAVRVAVGGGAAVGWFPLGPREVYVPSYPVSRTYVNNVNITNTTVNTTVVNNYYNNVVVNKNVNVTNVTYVNQSVPGAVTATSTQTFTSAQSVHNNVMRVNEREMAGAPVVAATPPMPPTRQSVEGAGRPAAARPPAPVVAREVVAKTAPPPPPAKFERQQAAIQQNEGRPLAVSQVRQIQQQQQEQPKPEVRMAPPAARTVTPPQNAGNRPAPPQNVNRPIQQPSNLPQR